MEHISHTLDQVEAIARLSPDDLNRIDACLVSTTDDKRSVKVARVVGEVIHELKASYPSVPDSFYCERIAGLVKEGILEAWGDVTNPRFSEIRRLI
jgi:hypothetical protein